MLDYTDSTVQQIIITTHRRSKLKMLSTAGLDSFQSYSLIKHNFQ